MAHIQTPTGRQLQWKPKVNELHRIYLSACGLNLNEEKEEA